MRRGAWRFVERIEVRWSWVISERRAGGGDAGVVDDDVELQWKRRAPLLEFGDDL